MKVVFFPFNGNAIEALDCLTENTEVIAFVDDAPEKQGESYCDIPVLPRKDILDDDVKWMALTGSPTTFRNRKSIIESLQVPEGNFTQIISPKAVIGRKVIVGHNSLVMSGCVLTSNSVVGDHCVVLPNTVIHHDTVLGNYSVVGSNVTIAGNVTIGENVYIGSGSRIKNGITIGKGALIGMGSNVIRNVEPNQTVVGNPAKELIKTN
ncbi:acetyltransferase [Flavobacteriales bacterium]|nr:acetyltransferase [Flavobacteriales bacterium]